MTDEEQMELAKQNGILVASFIGPSAVASVVKAAGELEEVVVVARAGRTTLKALPSPNALVVEKMNNLKICSGTDCSEIAEELLAAAGGEGKVLRVTGQGGNEIRLSQDGIIESFKYHEVYTDGKFIYDPRYSKLPILRGEWAKMILKLNPGAVIK
jgi:hypothetical protein